MTAFISNKKAMDFGIPQTKKVTDLSHLSLNSRVFKQPVFILKDGRKVGLNPKKFTKVR